MKEFFKSENSFALLPILGLTFLLLLAPCNVRNFIQLKLDVSQTDVTNKSKTTFQNNGCEQLDSDNRTATKVKSSSVQQPFSNATIKISFRKLEFNTSFLKADVTENESSIQIPLYILYQNFKDHL